MAPGAPAFVTRKRNDDGATSNPGTVRTAALLVADPSTFVATARNCRKGYAIVVVLTDNDDVVAPEYGAPSDTIVHVEPPSAEVCHR